MSEKKRVPISGRSRPLFTHDCVAYPVSLLEICQASRGMIRHRKTSCRHHIRRLTLYLSPSVSRRAAGFFMRRARRSYMDLPSSRVQRYKRTCRGTSFLGYPRRRVRRAFPVYEDSLGYVTIAVTHRAGLSQYFNWLSSCVLDRNV